MKVLIAGGFGIIGADLVRYILEQNNEVSVLTRVTSDLWPSSSVLSDVKVIPSNNSLLETKVKFVDVKAETIFHLVWAHSQGPERNVPNNIRVNLMHKENIMDLAKLS